MHCRPQVENSTHRASSHASSEEPKQAWLQRYNAAHYGRRLSIQSEVSDVAQLTSVLKFVTLLKAPTLPVLISSRTSLVCRSRSSIQSRRPAVFVLQSMSTRSEIVAWSMRAIETCPLFAESVAMGGWMPVVSIGSLDVWHDVRFSWFA